MFKKTICLLLATFLLCSVWVTAATEQVYGDVTLDGKVNANDALEVLKSIVGKADFSELQKTCGDVSDDGTVNAEDALQILQYVVGNRSVFDVELFSSAEGLDSVKAYQTDFSAYNYSYPVTLTQIGYGYNGEYDVDVSYVLGYASTSYTGNGAPYWSLWADKYEYGKDVVRGIMVPVTRDGLVRDADGNQIGEYRNLHPERGMMDVQTDFGGNYMDHPTEDYYMVPTDAYIDYKWGMLQSHLDTGLVKIVALEEPEFFNKAGYSQGYQQAYEEYYGEEWEDFDLSPEAMYKNQSFKAYMFYHAFDVLSSRIKAKYPDVEVYVASHCTTNYAKHSINSCLGMICSLDTIDGVIAQVWSDSVNMSFSYGGGTAKQNPFATALYEYNCYGEMLRDDQKLYLLQDPASDDTTLSAEDKEGLWHHTVVASMMQNDSAAFETPIWPGRAFGSAGDEYKTVILNGQRMFSQLHQYDTTLYTGTPGIAFGMSDSAGWHRWATGNITGDCLPSITSVTYPLMNDGVAVDTVWLDNLTDVKQLRDVNLLILTYDVTKPLSPKVNQVIAQWVKEGGRLLYYGGTNNFNTLSDTWWGEAETTPLEHLIDQMGIDVQVEYGKVPELSTIRWSGGGFNDEMISFMHAPYCISFKGSGFNSFMTADGVPIGITAPCGKGKVTMVGVTASLFNSEAGYQAAIDMAQIALRGSKTPYFGSSVYAAKRGNYFGVHPMKDGIKLDSTRTYLDLFDANMSVKRGTTLQKDHSYLFYDITDALQTSVPTLVFSGDTLMDEKAFENNQSVFTIAAPTKATVASAFASGGKQVDSVTAMDSNGNTCSVKFRVDQSVVVIHTTVNNVKAPVTVTVNWK